MNTINLNPVEEAFDARHLNALVDCWLAQLRVSPVTHRSYTDKVRHFTDWWGNVGPAHNWQLTRSLLQAFEVHLRTFTTKRFNAPLAYSHRFAIVRTVRSMFRWASETNRTAKNYGHWVPWPEGSTPERTPVTLAHLERLMQIMAESSHGTRNQAMLAFFIGTGCRLGEVTGLTVEDLTIMADGSGTARVTGKRTKANRSGQRTVAFDSTTGRYLIRYMDEWAIRSGPLWLTKFGKTFTQIGIYTLFKRSVAQAGLSSSIKGCHDLRRAFATCLIMLHPESPAWGDLIRRQLGHSSFSMTAHYAKIGAEHIRQRIISPLALPGPDVK